ncbi:hypothetical protein OPQ81_003500 [Rhizoctonia solani]|nr:hypothetical protein OPQ81_003500 [Rhizoctonia solani]
MTATKENPIIFYDLGDGKGSSWPANTYKTRLTLPEIEPKLKELGVGPTSDTHPRYTLPVIADPSSDPNGKPTYVAESFAIAAYLDEKYPAPEYPAIFPPGTRGVQHLLINQYFPTLNALMGTLLYPKVPQFFDEKSVEYLRRTRPPETFKSLAEGEETKKWLEVRDKFIDLAKSLDLNRGDLFIIGSQPSFIDFYLGGLFSVIEKVDDAQMREIASWHGGRWGNYWGRLREIEEHSTEVY